MTRQLASGLLLLVLVASCAPRQLQVPALDRSAVEVRYRAMLDAHRRRVQAVRADLVFRARAPERGPLPWVNGRMVLAAPDRWRVVLGSLFGTALDLAARGDTLEAWVPKDKVGLSFESAGDSLGVHRPGRLAYRVLSGAWRPPEAAWRESRSANGVLVLGWREEADSLTLELDPQGRPRAVTWNTKEGARISAHYAAWSMKGGVPWPGRVDLDSLPGGWSVQCRMARVRLIRPPGQARMALQFPSTYTVLTRSELRAVIEHLGRDQ